MVELGEQPCFVYEAAKPRGERLRVPLRLHSHYSSAAALRELREEQPPEAQQRIDSILKNLLKQEGAADGGNAKPKPGADGFDGQLEIEIEQ